MLKKCGYVSHPLVGNADDVRVCWHFCGRRVLMMCGGNADDMVILWFQ